MIPRSLVRHLVLGVLATATVLPTRSARSEPALDDAVRAFLESRRARIAAAGSLEGLRPELRILWRDLEDLAAAGDREPSKRVAMLEEARRALAAGIARELPGSPGEAAAAGRAGEVIDSARKDHHRTRIEHLERSLICWCPQEDWTRSLAGCPEPCAGEQKALIREWIGKGYTDAEIIDRMVARAGPKVRGAPEAVGTNWVGYLLPVVLFAVGGVLLLVLLAAMTRRARAVPGQAVTSPAAAEDPEDTEAGERIERELREMEG